jgi:Icc protein
LGINTAYYFNAVMEQARQSGRHFDLCLLTGDLVQDPYPESYRYLLAQLHNLEMPIRCLPGNHDNPDLMETVINTESINCHKRTVLGNWQLINLNSQIPDSPNGWVSEAELLFLEKCLKENPDLYTLIAVHHHALATGSQWMDTMMIKNAQDLLALIHRYPNARAMIKGHIHQEMSMQVGPIRILSTPSTCFQFKPRSETFSLDDAPPGYRWLNLYPDGSIDSGVVRLSEPLSGLQKNSHGY